MLKRGMYIARPSAPTNTKRALFVANNIRVFNILLYLLVAVAVTIIVAPLPAWAVLLLTPVVALLLFIPALFARRAAQAIENGHILGLGNTPAARLHSEWVRRGGERDEIFRDIWYVALQRLVRTYGQIEALQNGKTFMNAHRLLVDGELQKDTHSPATLIDVIRHAQSKLDDDLAS